MAFRFIKFFYFSVCKPSAQNGDQRAVHDFIESGIDKNALDEDERTPLHWAASKGHIQVVGRYIQIS